MHDLHAGYWGSLHIPQGVVLPACDAACCCMFLDRLFGAHCKRPARELQANWNPVLNLYENSEFVEFRVCGIKMAASLGQSNGHPGISLCIACEDACLTSLHALGRTLDTHIAILALWRERVYVSGLDMMHVLMHVLHADYSVALHQWTVTG